MSNFDKQIKQKGENFSLQPRPQVWKRVEAELNKKNRGRIIGWWWLTPVVIIAWGFAFYFLDRKDKKAFYDQDATHHPLSVIQKPIPAQRPASTQATADNNHFPATRQTENVIVQKTTRAIPADHARVRHPDQATSPASPQNIQETAATHHISKPGKTAAMAENAPPSHKISTIVSDNSENIAIKSEEAGNPAADKKKFDSHTIEHLSLEGEKSNTSAPETTPAGTGPQPAQQLADQKAVSHSNVVTNVAIGNAANNKVKAKKSSWRLTLSGGVSNNEEYIFKKHPKDTIDPNSGGSTGTVPEMEKNRYGYTVGLSAERIQWLGKRWQWQVGLMAQYQQMKQLTGVLQPYQVDPSPPDWSYSSFFYFDPGKEYNHKGENYRLSITNDLAFSIFRKPSVFIKAGVYGGLNAYNRYLLPDEVQVWWIPTGDYYKTWVAGVNAGVEYRFKKGAVVGLDARHDLTHSFTSLAQKKYFWRSATVSFSIPLTFK